MAKIEKVLYRGSATSTGGREGKATSSDHSYDLKLSTPKELGGAGAEGTNPEQMFAGGYAACFMGAMKVVAGKDKITLPADTSITGVVGIGAIPNGFGIEVELKIYLPGLDKTAAKSLIEAAHQVCPYSNATRGNVEVTLTLV
jgi:osmotically inducible protein OsmC